MLDWLQGYWTAWQYVVVLVDWTDAGVQFFVTLLAGGISLYVARTTLAHQDRLTVEKSAAAELAVAGDAATVALYKLIDCGEILASMRNSLDEQFIYSSANIKVQEPYQSIRPSNGQDYPPSRVELSEIRFLIKSTDIELVSDIALVYRRTINCNHLSDSYSKLRVELHEWVQGLPGHEGSLNGDIANDRVPIRFKDQYERRMADLNLIVYSLVDQVDDTVTLIEDVVDRLGVASRAEFGNDFLAIKASFPRVPITLADIRRACLAHGVAFRL